jgi:hypothetical protein
MVAAHKNLKDPSCTNPDDLTTNVWWDYSADPETICVCRDDLYCVSLPKEYADDLIEVLEFRCEACGDRHVGDGRPAAVFFTICSTPARPGRAVPSNSTVRVSSVSAPSAVLAPAAPPPAKSSHGTDGPELRRWPAPSC